MPCCFSFQSGSPWSAFPVLFYMTALICKMFSFCFSFLLVQGENFLSSQLLFTGPHFHFSYFSVISHQVHHIVLWDTGPDASRVIWNMLCPLYMQRRFDSFWAVSILSSMLMQHRMLLDFWGEDHELLGCCLQPCLHFPAEPSHYRDFNWKINFTFILWCVLLHVYQWYLRLI